MMLAQANVLPPVPWSTTASVALGLLAILLILGSLLWVWNQLQEARERNSGKNRSLKIEPQPISVSKTSKRYNHDLAEERHEEIDRRLKEHDAELERLNGVIDEKVAGIGTQLAAMPGKIVADILNAKKLFSGGDK